MVTESATLEHIHGDLEFLKEKVLSIEKEVKEIKEEVEPEVREEYLQRLESIKKEEGRTFTNKEEFLHFLEHEL